MILEKIVRKTAGFEALLANAEPGDRILLLEGGDASTFALHRKKPIFYHRSFGVIYKNGEAILKGVAGEWDIIGDQVVLIEDKRIVDADTKIALFEGDYDSWVDTSDGFVIRKGNFLFKNGKDPVFEDTSGTGFKYYYHPKGFLIEKYRVLYLNGTKEIFTLPKKGQLDWRAHEHCVVTYRDQTFYLNDSFPIHSDWQSYWEVHSGRLLICQKDKIYLVVLKPFPVI